jgi:hypothetical protein
VTLRAGPRSIPAENVHEAGGVVLFGRGVAVGKWSQRLDDDEVTLERWRLAGPATEENEDAIDEPDDALLMLTMRRPGRVRPVDDETSFRERDESDVLINEASRETAEAWLGQNGWVPVELPEEKATQPATA